VPIGFAIGAWLGHTFLDAPTGESVARFLFSVFMYSILPLGLFDATVVFPRIPAFHTNETRRRIFGLFLVTTGVLLQLVASILDLVQ
jgi:hypothetical protein